MDVGLDDNRRFADMPAALKGAWLEVYLAVVRHDGVVKSADDLAWMLSRVCPDIDAEAAVADLTDRGWVVEVAGGVSLLGWDKYQRAHKVGAHDDPDEVKKRVYKSRAKAIGAATGAGDDSPGLDLTHYQLTGRVITASRALGWCRDLEERFGVEKACATMEAVFEETHDADKLLQNTSDRLALEANAGDRAARDKAKADKAAAKKQAAKKRAADPVAKAMRQHYEEKPREPVEPVSAEEAKAIMNRLGNSEIVKDMP